MAKSFNAVIAARLNTITTNGDKLNAYIHDTAMMILKHSQDRGHGDCSSALLLCKAMPASFRREMVVEWFRRFSPISISIQNDKVGLIKPTDKRYNAYDPESAAALPFYQIAIDTPEKAPMDFDALMKLVSRLGSQIEKKIEKGEVVEADIESAKAIAQAVAGLRVERVAQIGADKPLPKTRAKKSANDDKGVPSAESKAA